MNAENVKGYMKKYLKNKKVAIAALATAVIIVILWLALKPSGGINYKTEDIKKTSITEKVEASGKINPVTQTSVGTQISGKVQEIYADFNSVVKKGDLLAVIDPSVYESQVVQQQANVDRAQSQFNNSRRNYKRYSDLYADNLVAKSELDNAETDYLSAQSQLTQAKASLDKAKIDLGYTKIISPVNGIIISREIELGQTVAASFQTPTLFLVAEDLTKMQIEVAISEADISKISEGQQVEFDVDAYPNVTFEGKVSQVRNSPATVQNVVTYTVVVAVNNDDLKLKPGMTANASIITARKKDVLALSNQALRFVPPASAKIKGEEQNPASGQRRRTYRNQGVWVLDSKNVLERVEITAGITDGIKTEITGGNLTEGAQVAVSASDFSSKKQSSPSGGLRL
jgi:HlyD family secretion protein